MSRSAWNAKSDRSTRIHLPKWINPGSPGVPTEGFLTRAERRVSAIQQTREQAADDEAPHRRLHPQHPREGHQQAERLNTDFQRHERAADELPAEGKQRGRVEAVDGRRGPDCRDHEQEHRLAVEDGHCPAEQPGGSPQAQPAENLQGPGRVQEVGVVTALLLISRADAEIDEHVRPG